MAPEQLRGLPADARTDIYAAGTVFYEMGTGQRPFTGTLATALSADIQTRQPTAPSRLNRKISPRLEQIILKCLEKEASHRYQTARDLQVDLERLSRNAPEVREEPRKGGRRRLAAAVIGMAMIALVAGSYIASRNNWFGAQLPAGKIRMLVLPFDNVSRDPEQEYLSDGLTEEMIAQLGRVEPARLAVIARTSTMQYKGTKKSMAEIGRELGVDYVLEGSVRREGDRVRIYAELVQAREQTALWTETYERNLAGVFALQTEVAGRIARSLELELLPVQRTEQAGSSATTPGSYEAYLRGRHEWAKSTEDGRRKAKEYFEETIRLDPNYAAAYAGLADYFWATTEVSADTGIPKAREYVLKALSLDNALAEAHRTLAEIRFFGDWDWVAAEKEFTKALRLKPNDAEVQRAYGVYLLTIGRTAEALNRMQRALELDPQSPLINGTAGRMFYFASQYDRAIEQCRKALQLDARSVGPHGCLGDSYRAKGMYEQAIAESQQAVELSHRDPARVARLAWTYAAAGRKNDAENLLNQLRVQAKRTYVSPYYLALVHATLGQKKEALAALEKAYREHDRALVWLKVEEAFDSLRGDRSFQDLLRHVGFPT
jgi:TolB-like protein/Flp pilus assembly protein TadD